jgi:hypothetical protein
MFLVYSSNIDKNGKWKVGKGENGKRKEERGFHFEPRRGDILIGRNIDALPHRARDGSGILLGNGAKRNEPKDTADSPVNGGEAKLSHRAGAMIKGMRKQVMW